MQILMIIFGGSDGVTGNELNWLSISEVSSGVFRLQEMMPMIFATS